MIAAPVEEKNSDDESEEEEEEEEPEAIIEESKDEAKVPVKVLSKKEQKRLEDEEFERALQELGLDNTKVET